MSLSLFDKESHFRYQIPLENEVTLKMKSLEKVTLRIKSL